MDSWILLGLMAALFFGLSGIALKLGMKESSVPPLILLIIFVGGVVSAVVAGTLWKGMSSFTQLLFQRDVILWVFLAGILWTIGQSIVMEGFAQGGAIAKMAPLYNLNTLIVVFLGIFFLQEIPSSEETVRVIIGAVLTVIGTMLVVTS